jgi:hypothetical protein
MVSVATESFTLSVIRLNVVLQKVVVPDLAAIWPLGFSKNSKIKKKCLNEFFLFKLCPQNFKIFTYESNYISYLYSRNFEC